MSIATIASLSFFFRMDMVTGIENLHPQDEAVYVFAQMIHDASTTKRPVHLERRVDCGLGNRAALGFSRGTGETGTSCVRDVGSSAGRLSRAD